jgi:hypothetical protein
LPIRHELWRSIRLFPDLLDDRLAQGHHEAAGRAIVGTVIGGRVGKRPVAQVPGALLAPADGASGRYHVGSSQIAGRDRGRP